MTSDALTVVHLLRHGEVHNPDGILYGRLPGYRLSEHGASMAEAVADHLAGRAGGGRRDVVAVVSSPLERAQQTAEPVAAAFGLEPATDPRLIEAGNDFEGMTFGVGDGSLAHPRHWLRLRNPFLPSWGEPYRDQALRMLGAVAEARRAAEGHEAVLVSHQLPIWVARCAMSGRRLWHDPRNRQCSLASLTSLRFVGEEFVGIHYSEPAAHLLPAAAGVPGA